MPNTFNYGSCMMGIVLINKLSSEFKDLEIYVDARTDINIERLRMFTNFEKIFYNTDYDKLRRWGKMTINFTTPENATDAYLHFSFVTRNTHVKDSNVFIDNLICVPTVVSYKGNSIRKAAANTPQALRYKFSVKNETLESFNGMQVG